MKSHKTYLRTIPLTAVFLAAILLGFLCSGNTALAESPNKKVGRLADGRAYRVDQNGLQLVDYVAELEVAKNELERQVHALEDELMEKNSTIQQITKGKPLPPAAGREPQTGSPAASVTRSDAALSACQTVLNQTTARANQLQAALQSQPQPRCNYESAENPYRQEVARLQTSLREMPGKISAEQSQRQESEEQLESAKQKVSSQQAKLADQEDKLAEQEQKLAAQNEQIAKLEEKLADSQLALNKLGRASLAAKPIDAPTAAEVTASNRLAARAPAAPTGSAAIRPSVEVLANARSELRADLQKIQGLISQRKSLLDSASRRGPSVSIKIQPLVSKEGVSLDSLRLSVERLNADSDITAIRKGLNDITALLSEDIGVLSRIGKL